MNYNAIKHQAQLQHWAEIIQKRNQSGMKVLDFCHQEGISKDAYYYWLRRVREAVLESQPEENVQSSLPQLVNITPPKIFERNQELSLDERPNSLPNSIGTPFSVQLTVTVGKSIIGVNQNTPKELLASVLEVLANV